MSYYKDKKTIARIIDDEIIPIVLGPKETLNKTGEKIYSWVDFDAFIISLMKEYEVSERVFSKLIAFHLRVNDNLKLKDGYLYNDNYFKIVKVEGKRSRILEIKESEM